MIAEKIAVLNIKTKETLLLVNYTRNTQDLKGKPLRDFSLLNTYKYNPALFL